MGSDLQYLLPAPSSWPWIDHPVSGLRPATNSPFQTRFATPPYSVKLATERKSLTHYTKVRSHPFKEAPTVCMHAVSGSISLPPGFFSPFPHGTGSLSVDYEYLALEDGPHIQTGFRVPPYLSHAQYHQSFFTYRAITHYGRAFHPVLLNLWFICRLFPFRSPLLWESRLISFPRLLRCFSSPVRLHMPMYSAWDTLWPGFPIRTSPDQSFICQLPEAFRRLHVLHRLSSPRHPPHALIRLIL